MSPCRAKTVRISRSQGSWSYTSAVFTRIKDEPSRDVIRRFVAQERLQKTR